MSTPAVSCTHPSCRRTTADPTGRCHDHRTSGASATGTPNVPAPTPALSLRYSGPRSGEAVEELPDGSRVHRWYGPSGRPHRVGAPAVIGYDPLGRKVSEEWSSEGHPHRLGGPAHIRFDPTGVTRRESWLVQGELHRFDGPAERFYRSDGSYSHEDFYLDGELYGDRAAAFAEVAQWSDSRLDSEMRSSAFALLLRTASARRVFGVIAEGLTTVDGVRARLEGAPLEWARAYEEGSR